MSFKDIYYLEILWPFCSFFGSGTMNNITAKLF